MRIRMSPGTEKQYNVARNYMTSTGERHGTRFKTVQGSFERSLLAVSSGALAVPLAFAKGIVQKLVSLTL
jgi:hypothetical protein